MRELLKLFLFFLFSLHGVICINANAQEYYRGPAIIKRYWLPEYPFQFDESCIKRNETLESYCQPAPIRNQAIMMVNKENSGPFSVAQLCDVWSFFNQNWTYVEDPFGMEYFEGAKVSLQTMRGDCDDYAIAIATCIRAIGGFARIKAGFSHNAGHAYAQVCIGRTDSEEIEKYIQYRYPHIGKDFPFTYEVDPWGNIWLNLDYLNTAPGGPLFPAHTGFVFYLGYGYICLDF